MNALMHGSLKEEVLPMALKQAVVCPHLRMLILDSTVVDTSQLQTSYFMSGWIGGALATDFSRGNYLDPF